ncbi:FAD/NAD(P)-binding protein [Abyssicoccus albus]|uniref:NADPH-dependent L-lysine 6-monooxygenase-like protein n=1 Tax=Abyssicoccus albus TaxID=1817405 RepID=A0A3N5CAC6_9BACL|nr:FAD/NAD(P)-binding protein [Abyssicoccus albus]RPF56672.1 NADPH-dependent L-lysine 6-monooxygenase-like protein [Abyssicoccus albus]
MNYTIIGGGIHGITVAAHMIEQGIAHHELTIVDPNPSLGNHFIQQTSKLHMEYLRSPYVHHCHPEAFHLKQFAKQSHYENPTKGQYQRPRLDLFIAHMKQTIELFNLNQCHVHHKVTSIEYNDNRYVIQLDDHSIITTDVVILAIGSNVTKYMPISTQSLDNVFHVDDIHPNEQLDASHVIGCGISAAHVVCRIHKEDPIKTIHLWVNKPLACHAFDADPGWLGPKLMNHYLNQTVTKRLSLIKHSRYKGSMPKELYRQLHQLEKESRLIVHNTEIQNINNKYIYSNEEKIKYDKIICATGYISNVEHLTFLHALIKQQSLQLINGFPRTSVNLEWTDRLYVTGFLADIEVGPFARSIHGGRVAAKKICEDLIDKYSRTS